MIVSDSVIEQWNFHNPTEIYFGQAFPQGLKGHLQKVPTLYVTSPGSTRRGVTAQMETWLKSEEIPYQVLDYATANPSFADLTQVHQKLGNFRAEQIVALGGGSVLDLAKILSYTLARKAPTVVELLKTLESGKTLPEIDPVPFVAIATTAGTGSEVTPFATLWDMVNKKKYSVATKNLHPRKAWLSPALTLSLPWDVTLSTGLDALSQALESVWNKNATPVTLALAQASVKLIFKALPQLKLNPQDLPARTAMLEASLLSGLCISRTRTALAHSISYPLTAHYGTPHGIACSFTLPELWQFNLAADDGRMQELCKSLSVDAKSFASDLEKLLQSLGFAAEFKKTVKTPGSVLRLSEEMYTPGRADNSLQSFAAPALQTILQNSLRQWEI